MLLLSESFRDHLHHLLTSRMNQHGNVAFDMPRRLVVLHFLSLLFVLLRETSYIQAVVVVAQTISNAP